MPNRPASQPVSGVMIAAATMYEVTTQAIWSCEADSEPCMCGRATLVIVVSTPCMNVASMIEIVIATRLAGRAAELRAGAPPHRCLLARLGGAEQAPRHAVEPDQPRPAVMRVNFDRGAEAGMQQPVGIGAFERQGAPAGAAPP